MYRITFYLGEKNHELDRYLAKVLFLESGLPYGLASAIVAKSHEQEVSYLVEGKLRALLTVGDLRRLIEISYEETDGAV